MSDHSSSGNRPLIPGQIAAWLGVVSLVAAGLIVTGYSYLALRQGTSEDALRRQAQKDLRAENAKKADFDGVQLHSAIAATGAQRVIVR